MKPIPQRTSAKWMIQLDDRILENIASEGWSTPSIMAKARGFTAPEGVIRDRCKRLHYAGLAAPIHGRMYELTGEGQRYLDGDLDARHQPYPKASAVFKRWSFQPGWSPEPARLRL